MVQGKSRHRHPRDDLAQKLRTNVRAAVKRSPAEDYSSGTGGCPAALFKPLFPNISKPPPKTHSFPTPAQVFRSLSEQLTVSQHKMSTTSEAIYYSDEEYSSDYSGSDLDVDDPHPFGNNTRRTIQNGKPKERIRRTGKVPLNLTRNYGLKSGWGMSQGFRELIQNLYKHSFRFCC